METVLLVIHLMIAVALICVVLMQRTAQDGGGLMGGGGGGTMGGLFTARGSANLLTRITAVLATSFICTSLILGIIASQQHKQRSIADQIAPVAPVSAPATEAPAQPAEAPAMPSPPQVPVSK